MAARCQTYLRHFNSTGRSSQGSESTSTVNTGQYGQGTARGESCSLIAPGKKKQLKTSQSKLSHTRTFLKQFLHSSRDGSKRSIFVTSTFSKRSPKHRKQIFLLFTFPRWEHWTWFGYRLKSLSPWCRRKCQGQADVGKVIYLSAVNPCLTSTVQLFCKSMFMIDGTVVDENLFQRQSEPNESRSKRSREFHRRPRGQSRDCQNVKPAARCRLVKAEMSIGQSRGRQNVKPAVRCCLVKAEMSQVKSSQVYDFYVHLWQPHTSFFWTWVKP